MSKVAKSKGKTRGKHGKCAEEHATNRHIAFKITIRGDFKCFCITAGTCIKKRNLVFNIM